MVMVWDRIADIKFGLRLKFGLSSKMVPEFSLRWKFSVTSCFAGLRLDFWSKVLDFGFSER